MTQERRLETFICFQMGVILLLVILCAYLFKQSRRYDTCRHVMSELEEALR
jgi:hypothetical protein